MALTDLIQSDKVNDYQRRLLSNWDGNNATRWQIEGALLRDWLKQSMRSRGLAQVTPEQLAEQYGQLNSAGKFDGSFADFVVAFAENGTGTPTSYQPGSGDALIQQLYGTGLGEGSNAGPVEEPGLLTPGGVRANPADVPWQLNPPNQGQQGPQQQGPIPTPKPTPGDGGLLGPFPPNPSDPPPTTQVPGNWGPNPNIPPPVSVGGETRNPNLPITPGQGGGGNFPQPGGQGGWPGSSNTLASYGLLGGPNGEILPVMLNQGASPFQQMRQTPQIAGFNPAIPQGVQQLPQFQYQQGLPDYDWYTPPPPPTAPPAPPGNADGLPGNNSGGNNGGGNTGGGTGGGTAPPMGPGSGFYRDNISMQQKMGLLGGPANASMGLLGNPYGAALPPALMGLLK